MRYTTTTTRRNKRHAVRSKIRRLAALLRAQQCYSYPLVWADLFMDEPHEFKNTGHPTPRDGRLMRIGFPLHLGAEPILIDFPRGAGKTGA